MIYKYIGCFFDIDASAKLLNCRDGSSLAVAIKSLHVTAEYEPTVVDTDLFGAEIEVTVIGYGNNGRNEGLLVEVHSDNEAVQSLFKKISVPHITLSRAKDADSVDTKDLTFRSIAPVRVTGRFGAYTEDIGPVVGIYK